MARSTTSTQQFGTAQQPQGQGHAGPQGVELDAYGRPLDPNQRWAPQQGHYQPQQPASYAPDPHAPVPGHYGYGAQPAYADHGQPGAAYPAQQGYADPAGYPAADYPTAPPQGAPHGYAPDPYAPPHGYAPHQQGYPAEPYGQPGPVGVPPQGAHFETYNPHQPAAQPGHGYDRFDTQLHIDPHAQAGHPPAHDPRRYDPHGQHQAAPVPAGYGGHYASHPEQHGHYDPAQHAAHGQPQVDPRNWDLSQYPPPGAHLGQQHAPLGYQGGDTQHGGHHDPRWAEPAAPGWQQPGPPPYPEPHYDPANPHGQQPSYGQPGQVAGGFEPHDGDPALSEDEVEAPRRPRALLVVGALVGAIALGGGLAYGYKKFVATGANSATPIVKADKTPTRVKPTEPSGKEQPHTDKKIFANRLDEKGGGPTAVTQAPAAPATPAAPTDADAPRKVQTVIVNRDGSLTPSAPPAAPPPVSAGPAPMVPGMVVDGLAPRPELRGPAPQDRVASPPVTPVQKATAAPPKVAELPLPKVKPEAKAEAPAATAPPRKKPAVRDDLVAQQQVAAAPATPGGAPAPAAKAPGANGYVAVLTSRKSREEALKSFADLHQKYGEVLGNRPTDVREVNLGEKGIWYRSIVGPPGSKEAAMAVCKQLKDQGFTGCFMMAY